MGISAAKRAAVYARDGYQCLKCHCVTDLTIDHICSKAMGGTDALDNLQTLCEDCNTEKADGYADFRCN